MAPKTHSNRYLNGIIAYDLNPEPNSNLYILSDVPVVISSREKLTRRDVEHIESEE